MHLLLYVGACQGQAENATQKALPGLVTLECVLDTACVSLQCFLWNFKSWWISLAPWVNEIQARPQFVSICSDLKACICQEGEILYVRHRGNSC